MVEDSYWDHRALSVAPSAHRLRLGERAALFCARRQQLYELNPTADAIWRALAEHGTAAAAAGVLDAEPAQALGFVRQAALAWMRGGQLVPAEALSLPPYAQLDLEIDGVPLAIRLCGEVTREPVEAVFGQFASEPGQGPTLTLAGLGGLVFTLEGEQPLGAADARGWIAELKARITGLYADAACGGFLAHAALVSRNGRGLLVCGAPGDGKTTLAVALATQGFDYHADDIVRFDADGLANGVPFRPAAKSGAWPLLGDYVPELGALPVHLRGDGQEVRYLPLAPAPRRPLEIGAVLVLDRRAEAEARIEPLEPMEALTTILGSAWSSRGAIEADTLKALAAAVDAARCGRLRYADLGQAVRAVEAFA